MSRNTCRTIGLLGALCLAASATAAPVTVVTTAALNFDWSSGVGADWRASAQAPGAQPFGDVDMGNGISRNGSTPASAIQSSSAPITSLGNGQTFSLRMARDPDPNPQGNQFDLRSSIAVTNGTQNVQASPANVFRYAAHLDIMNPYGDLGVEVGAFIGTTFYFDTTGMPNGSHNTYWVMEWRAVVSDGARRTQHWGDYTRFNAHTYSPTGSTAIGQFTDTGVFTGALSGAKALPEAPFGYAQSWLNFDTYLTGFSADDAAVGSIDFFMDIAVSDVPFTRIPRDGGPNNEAPEPGTAALALLSGSLAWAARRRRSALDRVGQAVTSTILCQRLWAACCAAVGLALAQPVRAVPIHGQGTWETTLQARDFNGDNVADGFYDTVLNIVWLRQVYRNAFPADAEYQYNQTYGFLGDKSGPPSGLLRYPWAWRPGSSLADFPNWPYQYTNNGTALLGTAKTGMGWGTVSELGHLYYVTLGNQGIYVPNDEHPFQTVSRPRGCTAVNPADFFTCTAWRDGYGWANTGDFLGLPWLGYFLEMGDPYGVGGVLFDAETGQNFGVSRTSLGTRYHNLFVLDGDWGQPLRSNDIPEPTTAALALLGGSIAWAARRRRKGL